MDLCWIKINTDLQISSISYLCDPCVMIEYLIFQQDLRQPVIGPDDGLGQWCTQHTWLLCLERSILLSLNVSSKQSRLFSEIHKPVEREPWGRGFCCTVVLPTKYGLPQVAGFDQWVDLVSVLYIFWTPFRCPEHNFAEAADTSRRYQGWGCPVWF